MKKKQEKRSVIWHSGAKMPPIKEEQRGEIKKKKPGRPRKPNSTHLHLMMDGAIKERFRKYASKNYTDLSTLTTQIVRDFLDKKEAGIPRTINEQ